MRPVLPNSREWGHSDLVWLSFKFLWRNRDHTRRMMNHSRVVQSCDSRRQTIVHKMAFGIKCLPRQQSDIFVWISFSEKTYIIRMQWSKGNRNLQCFDSFLNQSLSFTQRSEFWNGIEVKNQRSMEIAHCAINRKQKSHKDNFQGPKRVEQYNPNHWHSTCYW
jgi:hypothetical protein